MAAERTEVWLRGEKIEGLSPLLQPIAHSLLEVVEEIKIFMEGFPEKDLWERPGGSASAGFHLKHIPGVIDRVLTYAEGSSLSEAQFSQIRDEAVTDNITQEALLANLAEAVQSAIERLKRIPDIALPEPRKVGRAGLPSTTMALCFHAAEHAMRHTGQLLVTVKWLKNR